MKEKRKKLLSSGLAVVCILAVLISGTLAWQAASSAINSFRDTRHEPPTPDADKTGANLHDDFAGMDGVEEVGGEYHVDKDVYVENTGNSNVFVRIQLSEKRDGDTDYTLFIPRINAAGEMVEKGSKGFEWILGSKDTTPKDFMSVTATTAWNDAVNPGQNSHLIGDAIGKATIAAGARANTEAGAPVAGKTQDGGGVVTIAQYNAAGFDKASFVGWIYDVDGYAYWSKPLTPGKATGRLLDAVKVPQPETLTYEYDIKVDMEYVDVIDLPAWLGEGTDGRRIVNVVTTAGISQWDRAMTNEKGEPIVAGKTGTAGTTTIEATSAAREILSNISKTLIAVPDEVEVIMGTPVALPIVKDGEATVTIPVANWDIADADKAVVKIENNMLVGVTAGGPITITGTDEHGNKVTFDVTVKEAVQDPETFMIHGPASVAAGGNGTYEVVAKVEKDDENNDVVTPADGITSVVWTVTGATKAETTMGSATGVLNVAADEVEGTILTVTGTYVVDGETYTATKLVTVGEVAKLPLRENETNPEYDGTSQGHQQKGSMHVELYRPGSGGLYEIDTYEDGRWLDDYPMSDIFADPEGISVKSVVAYKVSGMPRIELPETAFDKNTGELDGFLGSITIKDGMLKPHIASEWTDAFRDAWMAVLEDPEIDDRGLDMKVEVIFTNGTLDSGIYTVHIDHYNSLIALNW